MTLSSEAAELAAGHGLRPRGRCQTELWTRRWCRRNPGGSDRRQPGTGWRATRSGGGTRRPGPGPAGRRAAGRRVGALAGGALPDRAGGARGDQPLGRTPAPARGGRPRPGDRRADAVGRPPHPGRCHRVAPRPPAHHRPGHLGRDGGGPAPAGSGRGRGGGLDAAPPPRRAAGGVAFDRDSFDALTRPGAAARVRPRSGPSRRSTSSASRGTRAWWWCGWTAAWSCGHAAAAPRRSERPGQAEARTTSSVSRITLTPAASPASLASSSLVICRPISSTG
jgi:hypothetical protein